MSLAVVSGVDGIRHLCPISSTPSQGCRHWRACLDALALAPSHTHQAPVDASLLPPHTCPGPASPSQGWWHWRACLDALALAPSLLLSAPVDASLLPPHT